MVPSLLPPAGHPFPAPRPPAGPAGLLPGSRPRRGAGRGRGVGQGAVATPAARGRRSPCAPGRGRSAPGGRTAAAGRTAGGEASAAAAERGECPGRPWTEPTPVRPGCGGEGRRSRPGEVTAAGTGRPWGTPGGDARIPAAGCGRPCSAPSGDGRAPRAHVSLRGGCLGPEPRGQAGGVTRGNTPDVCGHVRGWSRHRLAGTARLWLQARFGPVQQDRELSRPLSGSRGPHPRRLCPRGGAALAGRTESASPGSGDGAGGMGTGASSRRRPSAPSPVRGVGGGQRRHLWAFSRGACERRMARRPP